MFEKSKIIITILTQEKNWYIEIKLIKSLFTSLRKLLVFKLLKHNWQQFHNDVNKGFYSLCSLHVYVKNWLLHVILQPKHYKETYTFHFLIGDKNRRLLFVLLKACSIICFLFPVFCILLIFYILSFCFLSDFLFYIIRDKS